MYWQFLFVKILTIVLISYCVCKPQSLNRYSYNITTLKNKNGTSLQISSFDATGKFNKTLYKLDDKGYTVKEEITQQELITTTEKPLANLTTVQTLVVGINPTVIGTLAGGGLG